MSRYPKYVSVAEMKEKNRKKIVKLLKKNPNLGPVNISGRAIAKTWWGKAWNKNLEIYADYSNRLSRGRSYLKNGAVVDLTINAGVINALVIGSGRNMYNVQINIDAMDEEKIKEIVTKIEGRLSSLEKLIDKFPKELKDLFTSDDSGLFPKESEIHFHCTCLDWADMCKHVVAVLYGVGVKLDEDPLLFFKLRNINVEDLISDTIEKKSDKMIEKSKTKSKRVIDDKDMSDMFGIDI